MRYEARIRAVAEGDDAVVRVSDASLAVEHADAVTLYFVAATNFVSHVDVSGDEAARVAGYLGKLGARGFPEVRADAVADHAALFSRASLTLPSSPSSLHPTNVRVRRAQVAPDPQMAALAYSFGRYVLISSSRQGTQPSNLQGIWCGEMNPSWDCKYTTNINLQMNYWAADSANLTELSDPLVQLIEELTIQGADVAREHYGAGGWVMHQNTDLWRVAAPMDGPTWGTFTTGGAWLVTHLWERYLYTRDMAFLEKVYPVMKGCVRFFLDFLIEQ